MIKKPRRPLLRNDSGKFVPLSPEKEQQIILLLKQGLSENKIASQVDCSRNTVKKVKLKNAIGNVFQIQKAITINLDLKIIITKLANDTLVEINYGDGEPLSKMEQEIKPMITDIIDQILKSKHINAIERRDFQYRLIRFPGRFFFQKKDNPKDV